MRTWPGLAAIGAGVVHLGIAAGAPALLIPGVLLGAVEVLWGVAALARPVPPVRRGALTGAAVAVACWVAALLLPAAAHHGHAAALPEGALTGAGALDLAVAVLLALDLRFGRAERGEPRPLPFLVAAGAAAAAVAGITASSLAGTAVGQGMSMH